MRKRFLMFCFFFQVSIIALVARGQSIVYSNKPFGITLNFPAGWQVLNSKEIAMLSNFTVSEVNLDSGTRTYEDDIAIIAIALEKRMDPEYTVQVISEKFTEDSKDRSTKEYLLQGIGYMRQQGINVTQFTVPTAFNTRNGFTFFTSKMEILTDVHRHFEKFYIIKRQNDFIIISGSFPEVSNDSWLDDVVNSISLTP